VPVSRQLVAGLGVAAQCTQRHTQAQWWCGGPCTSSVGSGGGLGVLGLGALAWGRAVQSRPSRPAASTPDCRKDVRKFHVRVASGRRPVKNELREGLSQKGWGNKGWVSARLRKFAKHKCRRHSQQVAAVFTGSDRGCDLCPGPEDSPTNGLLDVGATKHHRFIRQGVHVWCSDRTVPKRLEHWPQIVHHNHHHVRSTRAGRRTAACVSGDESEGTHKQNHWR
jgi:hypothetical protein